MTSPAPSAPRPRARRRILVAAGVALLIGWMLFASLFTIYRVEGESMIPALLPGQQVVAYRFGTCSQGDLVVFRNPLDPRELLIKRVHAVAGETVSLSGGKLRVNGSVRPLATTFFDELPPRSVRPGHLFVLGDNQAASLDSRRLGAVDEDLVVGKVVCRLWPFGAVQ